MAAVARGARSEPHFPGLKLFRRGRRQLAGNPAIEVGKSALSDRALADLERWMAGELPAAAAE